MEDDYPKWIGESLLDRETINGLRVDAVAEGDLFPASDLYDAIVPSWKAGEFHDHEHLGEAVEEKLIEMGETKLKEFGESECGE